MNSKILLCSLIMCGNLSAMKNERNEGEEIVKELESLTVLNLLQRNAYYLLSPEEQRIWETQAFNRRHEPSPDEVLLVQQRVVTNMIDDPFTRSVIHPYYLSSYSAQLQLAMLKRVAAIRPAVLRRVIGR